MLSSINFLFLTSLAITSWIILCYFKQIEEQRVEDIHDHFRMERAYEETMAPCRENYDIYLNFLCIFACIYALARVTNMTEKYIAKQVHARFRSGDQRRNDNDSDSLEEYRTQQEELMLQVNNLQQSNTQLEQQLQQSKAQLELQLAQSKTQLEHQLQQLQQSSKIFVMGNQLPIEGEDLINDNIMHNSGNNNSNITTSSNNNNNNNIFISNRHFHLNRQVYVNEGNVKLNLPEFKTKDGGDFSQIWSKYLEMQKYAIKAHLPMTLGHEHDLSPNSMPIVVSTEQLQSIQGSIDKIGVFTLCCILSRIILKLLVRA